MLENQFATYPRFGGLVMTALATGNAYRRSSPAGAGYWSTAGRMFQWQAATRHRRLRPGQAYAIPQAKANGLALCDSCVIGEMAPGHLEQLGGSIAGIRRIL